MISNKVQYERLRPAQIVARREQFPVAYLPLGTIEWHGEHNPVGLDALKIHALLIKCAESIGGLVFPTLYYGENREQSLMESNVEYRDDIAAKMSLDPQNFHHGYMKETPYEQNRNYHRLLVHILHEIKSLGFKILIIGCGHYPLLDFARSAAGYFHQDQSRPKMITWAMSGYELLDNSQFNPCGDHGGKWETSLLMCLDPGMQDMAGFENEENADLTAISDNGVETSNPEFGKRAVDAIITNVRNRISVLFDKYDQYQKHGLPM